MQQHQQKTPRAQQYTSSLVIRCAHGKLNVKHHRTTSKPAIQRVSQQRKTKLCRPENSIEHQNVHRRRSSSSASSLYTYVCIRARPISTNLRCTEEECEYGLPSGTCFTARRLEVVVVAGLLWMYFVVCFFSVWCDFVFFSFSLLRTHTAYFKSEATLPHVPLYLYRGVYRVPLFN